MIKLLWLNSRSFLADYDDAGIWDSENYIFPLPVVSLGFHE